MRWRRELKEITEELSRYDGKEELDIIEEGKEISLLEMKKELR